MSTASVALAQLRARNAVKDELRRQGVKVSHIAAKEITARAHEYLAAHPELVAEARPVIERWTAEGVFGKRLCAGECWARHAGAPSVPGPSQYPEYNALHGASARPVCEVLAGLVRALSVWTIRRNVGATCRAH
jgi:hypothetical protein